MRFSRYQRLAFIPLCLISWLGTDASAALGEGLTIRPRPGRAQVTPRFGDPRSEERFLTELAGPRTRSSVEAAEVTDAKTTPLMARAIRQSYEALGRYAEASGKGLSFRLSDFRTYEASEFGFIRWFDVVTMPGGDSLQVEARTHQSGGDPSRGRTEYVPAWRVAKPYDETKEGRSASDLTVNQAFQAALADEPRLAQVTHLTSYDVTLRFEGRSRTYRAAFLWGETRDGMTMLVYDLVTGRVDTGVVEKFPPGNKAPRVKPAGDETIRNKEACIAEEVDIRGFALYQAGFTGHSSGYHAVNGGFSASCVCNSDCSQDCTANGYANCEEWGDTDTCHRISDPGFASGDGHAASGTTTCKAAAACSWKSCFGCLCSGPTISISGGGAGFSISPGNTPFAALAKDSYFNCSACRTAPPPPPPGGGGGGEEGGGGGSGMCDEGNWVTEWECVYVCGGWSDGQYCYVDPNQT